MLRATHIAESTSAEYAKASDFCRIFNQDMNGLYLLALLLTGDSDKAQQCFVAGLDDARGRNTVFKEWARSWARRVIVQNALRIVNPRHENASGVAQNHATDRPEIAAVLAIPTFERFVFVMSVLEGYSDHDCAILLNCPRKDVASAKVRALEHLGAAADLLETQMLETACKETRFSLGALSTVHAAA